MYNLNDSTAMQQPELENMDLQFNGTKQWAKTPSTLRHSPGFSFFTAVSAALFNCRLRSNSCFLSSTFRFRSSAFCFRSSTFFFRSATSCFLSITLSSCSICLPRVIDCFAPTQTNCLFTLFFSLCTIFSYSLKKT